MINHLVWNRILVGLVCFKLYCYALVKTVWFGMMVIVGVSCKEVTKLPLFLDTSIVQANFVFLTLISLHSFDL